MRNSYTSRKKVFLENHLMIFHYTEVKTKQVWQAVFAFNPSTFADICYSFRYIFKLIGLQISVFYLRNLPFVPDISIYLQISVI